MLYAMAIILGRNTYIIESNIDTASFLESFFVPLRISLSVCGSGLGMLLTLKFIDNMGKFHSYLSAAPLKT